VPSTSSVRERLMYDLLDREFAMSGLHQRAMEAGAGGEPAHP